jgi:hypothetical protein
MQRIFSKIYYNHRVNNLYDMHYERSKHGICTFALLQHCTYKKHGSTEIKAPLLLFLFKF